MKIEMVDPEPPTTETEPEPGPVTDPAPAAVDTVRKFYCAEMKALKNGDVEAYVSTESVDRVGDILKAKGWQIDNYRKTGAPVLWSHDYAIPPIGTSVEMEVQRKGLWSVTRFHEKTQLSRDLAYLTRSGILKSFSVGFNPLDEPEMRKDEKGNFLGYIFNKQELLEYSLVAVPANPDAVSKAVSLAHRGVIGHQLASIIAGPSPSADTDSGFGGNEQVLRARQATEQHEKTVLANYFVKRCLDGRR